MFSFYSVNSHHHQHPCTTSPDTRLSTLSGLKAASFVSLGFKTSKKSSEDMHP